MAGLLLDFVHSFAAQKGYKMAYFPGITCTGILTCWCWHHPCTTSTATPLSTLLSPQRGAFQTHPLSVPVDGCVAKSLSQQEVERIYRCFNKSTTAKEINADARPSIS